MLRLCEITNPKFGMIFKQISAALRTFMPGVTWVNTPQESDFTIVEMVGGEEYIRALDIPSHKRIIWQHCLYTTAMPMEMWIDLWKNSYCTMSFHDLAGYFPNEKFRFYPTPLGANTDIFYPKMLNRSTKVFTTGHVANTEHLDDIFKAVQFTGNTMVHTGENFGWNNANYKHLEFMPEPVLADLLNVTQYVIGLRDIEGFEVHCIQGAMCGATPIVLDLPTYRYYKDFAIMLDPKQDIAQQLIEIFKREYTPLPLDIIKGVMFDFSWRTIMQNLRDNIF